MFELSVQRVVPAAHAIEIRGERESLHGHHWEVTVTVAGERLDDDGLLCDFHALERALDAILEPFRNRSLNDVPPFDRVNPTAEHFARHVGESVGPRVPAGASLVGVRVTEAPGCAAVYRP